MRWPAVPPIPLTVLWSVFDHVIESNFSTDLYWFIESFLNPSYVVLLTWFQINPLSSLLCPYICLNTFPPISHAGLICPTGCT